MSGGFEIRVDARQFTRLANLIGAAGDKVPVAMARAINHTGLKAKTAIKRVLVVQTGLRPRTIDRAVQHTTAWPGRSTRFVIRAAGGNIRLKFFGAKETAQGVTAAPWNRRQLYTGAFIKGGRFPNRNPLAIGGGNVFIRAGRGRLPIKAQRSGLFIATEMISGRSREAFNQAVDRDLENRLRHELVRIVAG